MSRLFRSEDVPTLSDRYGTGYDRWYGAFVVVVVGHHWIRCSLVNGTAVALADRASLERA